MAGRKKPFCKCSRYVRYDENGEILEIMCKVCGSVIAGVVESVKGRRSDGKGNWIEERVVGLRYFGNYAEMKMIFEDGSAHVTNGCRKCLHDKLKPAQLKELHEADIAQAPTPLMEREMARVPARVVAVRHGIGGIA